MKTVFSAYKIIKNNGYQKWILQAARTNASADLRKDGSFELLIVKTKIS